MTPCRHGYRLFRRCLVSVVLVAPVLLTAACGGGSGSPEALPPAAPPGITIPPQNQTVVEGQSVVLAVAASGAGTLAYQWQRNGTDVGGATTATYTTPPLTPADSGAQYRVRVTAGGTSSLSATAGVQVLADAAIPAPQTQSIAPSAVGAGQDNAFGNHYVAYNPAVSSSGRLFVFFPGSGAVPDNYRLIVQAAANNGHVAIGLAYPNEGTITGACLGSSNADCTRLIRDETLTGNAVSPQVSVTPANAIRNRLATLLALLARQQPQAGWGRFVDAGGNLQWALIRVGGHSQGGGTAVHVGKQQAVDRACFFAAPGDTTDAQRSVAPWVAAAGATAAARQYGFAHVQDGIIPNALLLQEWAALQLDAFGAALGVDNAQPPYGGSHMLLTSVPRGNPLTAAGLAFHNLPVVDFFTPMEGGLPRFRRVWQTLCFAP